MHPSLLTLKPRCSPKAPAGGYLREELPKGSGAGCISPGKQRSPGGEAGAGSQGKQSRLVCTGCISSGDICSICRYVFKGDTRVQGSTRDAPGMSCPPGNWNRDLPQVSVGASHFPGGSPTLPLIFLTKRSPMGSSKNPYSLEKTGTNRGRHLGGAKPTVISHFARAPAGITVLM